MIMVVIMDGGGGRGDRVINSAKAKQVVDYLTYMLRGT